MTHLQEFVVGFLLRHVVNLPLLYTEDSMEKKSTFLITQRFPGCFFHFVFFCPTFAAHLLRGILNFYTFALFSSFLRRALLLTYLGASPSNEYGWLRRA